MDEIKARVIEALEQFWDERAIPGDPGEATTVDDLVGPVESLTAVDVLMTLDEIVGFKLPIDVIQAGGYLSRGEFVEKLGACVMSRVEAKTRAEA